jgi:GT2 family glycosyltransferase
MGADQLVTVAVVPRERFSYTRPSLENIYQNTPSPFALVYVDGGSPPPVRRYLENESRTRGFKLVRTNRYLSPNQARNLALQHVTTRYVVFVDNDVLVKPGWLEALVTCAERSGAAVVGPLIYAGEPGSESIHMAGGVAHIDTVNGKRVLREEHAFAGKRWAAVSHLLQSAPTELAEFHSMLVRTETLRQMGGLDENLLTALEHVDLCLRVREAGGEVYFEPGAAVTYVPPPPFAVSDYPFFMLRWSDAWNAATLRHFQAKWRLEDDDESLQELRDWLRNHRHIYFRSAWKVIYPVVGWRRANTIEELLSGSVARFVSPTKTPALATPALNGRQAAR